MTEQNNAKTPVNQQEDINHITAERRAKLEAIRAKGVAFPNDFKRTDFFGDLREK